MLAGGAGGGAVLLFRPHLINAGTVSESGGSPRTQNVRWRLDNSDSGKRPAASNWGAFLDMTSCLIILFFHGGVQEGVGDGGQVPLQSNHTQQKKNEACRCDSPRCPTRPPLFYLPPLMRRGKVASVQYLERTT